MMNSQSRGDLDHARITEAADRIIRQFHLKRPPEPAVQLHGGRAPADPDNVAQLRLAIDAIGQRLEHFERVMNHRDNVFLAALERVERNLARTEGRMDAVAEALARSESRPGLTRDAVRQDLDDASSVISQEIGAIVATGRAFLEEARDLRDTQVKFTEISLRSIDSE